MSKITVVPADKAIMVDGYVLNIEYDFPDNIHAIQYNTESEHGHIEWEYNTDSGNTELFAEDYEEKVYPYVKAWNEEKARLEKEAAEAKAKADEFYESEEQYFVRLRVARDRKLAATDYLMAVDYPLSDEDKAKVTAYRRALRDLPAQEGAPWKGTNIPWPELNLD
jgi:hypothetical protein